MTRPVAGVLAALVVSAPAAAQDYRFPTSADDYAAFYPTAYRDNGGTTDWNCGGITYSGHGGSDFGGGSWTGMDEGRDITAAAAGTVVDAHDGEYDRCSTGDCSGGGGYGNYVKIAHADGKSTIYGHLKQWSVAVSSGQSVSCGQKLGEMGSSGYSTGPHVHFEVREPENYSSDPFDGPCSAPPTYWVDQGAYGALPGLVCDDVPPCAVITRLHCGETLSLRNDQAGATTEHAAYGSCNEYTYSGPEIAIELATTLDEPVTVRMGGLSADLDLMLLTSEVCDGTGCLAASVNSDASDEALSFTAAANARYVLVVDGYEGAVSNLTLSAECTGGWPGESTDTGDPPDTGEPVDTATDTATDTALDSDARPVDTAGDGPGAAVERAGLSSCGCASGGRAAPAVGLVMLAAALTVRRRRP